MEISASFSRTLLCVKYEEKRFALFCTFYLFLKEFFYTFLVSATKFLPPMQIVAIRVTT